MPVPAEADLEIKSVETAADLKRFLAVPHRVYAGSKSWIAPLHFEQKQRFSAGNHFFQHARWKGWVALRDGQVVGRITAQVDSLQAPVNGQALGYFGMIDAIDDCVVFSVLFDTAEAWLREQGMDRVRGPLNLHVNEEVGLLVEGFDTPPYVLMGHAQPWYADNVLKVGYKTARDLLAYRIHPDFEAPSVMTKLAARVSGRAKVRPLRRDKLADDAETMREIFNDAWAENWGFVPLDAEDWAETVATLTKLMPDDYIQIAEYDDEPVAFIVALPNLNEAARDLNGKLLPFGWAKLLWRLKVAHPRSARIPLMGVRQAFQHSRLGPTLAFMVIDAVRQALIARGVTEVEMGWILEDNDGMRNIIETIGGQAYKRYRVYEKEL